MKLVDEFRDAERIRQAAHEIRRAVRPERSYRIMEICGGHTHAIFRFGLPDLLPPNLELIHGPGCPVCVLPMGRLDEGLRLADEPDVIFTAFGDMMRVPGSRGSPLESKARGADIRMVYSPLDALRLAERNPDRRVVFFAIGFETTAPTTALTIERARAAGVGNFSVFCNHVLVVPPLRALLDSPDLAIEGFIGPGHVSTIIGCEPYEFIARDYGRPVVVSGFEPLDLLHSILLVVRQLNAGEARVENHYRRAVAPGGNAAALRALERVFEVRDGFAWRGLGTIPRSALRIRDALAAWDAERVFAVERCVVADPPEARCGDVLRGALRPQDCPLFGAACTPERPIGALMVSAEGSCAACYQFRGQRGAGRPADPRRGAGPRAD